MELEADERKARLEFEAAEKRTIMELKEAVRKDRGAARNVMIWCITIFGAVIVLGKSFKSFGKDAAKDFGQDAAKSLGQSARSLGKEAAKELNPFRLKLSL